MLTQLWLKLLASRAVWGMQRRPYLPVLDDLGPKCWLCTACCCMCAGATKILSMLDRQEELGSVASEVSSPTAKASNQYRSPAACRLPVS